MSRTTRPGLKKASNKTILDFAANTTIHGIQYIFDGTVLFIEKIAWFLVQKVVLFGRILVCYKRLIARKNSLRLGSSKYLDRQVTNLMESRFPI